MAKQNQKPNTKKTKKTKNKKPKKQNKKNKNKKMTRPNSLPLLPPLGCAVLFFLGWFLGFLVSYFLVRCWFFSGMANKTKN